jgi:hypothetical protein
VSEHDEYCDTHFDQYPWECTCGATYRQQRDTIEAQAAAIKRLRAALRGLVEYLMSCERWQDDHPEYVAAARAALRETE